MTFEELLLPNKENVREKVLELYGRDIKEGVCHFSSRNYGFVLGQGCKPIVIRIGVENGKTRQDVMSEIMWVDDVRLHVPNIANPVPSNKDQLAETFEIDGTHYCVTAFRKANGDVTKPQDRDADFFYRVGKCLGQIHHTSVQEKTMGFCYKREKWSEKKSFDFTLWKDKVKPEVWEKANRIKEEVMNIPENPENFSMIHGDFQWGNIFMDWNDVWIFDFDDCCYGYFMYDIAIAMFGMIYDPAYMPMKNRKDLFYEILEHFKKGYEEENTLPEEQWDKLDLFVGLRICEIIGLVSMQKMIPENIRQYLVGSMSFCIEQEGSIIDAYAKRYEAAQQSKQVSKEELFGGDDRVTKK